MSRSKSDYEVLAATPERRASLEHHRLMMEAVQLLRETMARDGVSKANLAEKLGRTRGFVSQIFSGTGNLTLKTLGALSSALDFHIHLYASKKPKWRLQYDSSMPLIEDTPSPMLESVRLIGIEHVNRKWPTVTVGSLAQATTFCKGESPSVTLVASAPAGETMELFAPTNLNSSDLDTADGRAA